MAEQGLSESLHHFPLFNHDLHDEAAENSGRTSIGDILRDNRGRTLDHTSCHANGPNMDAVSTINLFALAKGDEKASLLGTLLECGAVAPQEEETLCENLLSGPISLKGRDSKEVELMHRVYLPQSTASTLHDP